MFSSDGNNESLDISSSSSTSNLLSPLLDDGKNSKLVNKHINNRSSGTKLGREPTGPNEETICLATWEHLLPTKVLLFLTYLIESSKAQYFLVFVYFSMFAYFLASGIQFFQFTMDNFSLLYSIVWLLTILSLSAFMPISIIVLFNILTNKRFQELVEKAIVLDKEQYVNKSHRLLYVNMSVLTLLLTAPLITVDFVGVLLTFTMFSFYFVPFFLALTVSMWILDALILCTKHLRAAVESSIIPTVYDGLNANANVAPPISAKMKGVSVPVPVVTIDTDSLRVSYVWLHDQSLITKKTVGSFFFRTCVVSVLDMCLNIVGLYEQSMSLSSYEIAFSFALGFTGFCSLAEILYYLSDINELGVLVSTLVSSLLIRLAPVEEDDDDSSSSSSSSNQKSVGVDPMHQSQSQSQALHDLQFIQCIDRSMIEVAFWGKFVLRVRMVTALIGALISAIVPHFLFNS